MTISGGDLRHPLTTREGWAAFVSRARPEPPRLLPGSDLERLTAVEREIYHEARQDYHSELLLVATPDIRLITTTGSKLIINNRGKQLGRRGLIVSGPSGTGKSTSITQLWIATRHRSVSGLKKVGTSRSALSCHPEAGVWSNSEDLTSNCHSTTRVTTALPSWIRFVPAINKSSPKQEQITQSHEQT